MSSRASSVDDILRSESDDHLFSRSHSHSVGLASPPPASDFDGDDTDTADIGDDASSSANESSHTQESQPSVSDVTRGIFAPSLTQSELTEDTAVTGPSLGSQGPPKTPPQPVVPLGSQPPTTPRVHKASSAQVHSITPTTGVVNLQKYRMELCGEVDPFLGIIDDEKWLSTYSSRVDPSSAARAKFPEFSKSKFNVTEENKMYTEFARVAQEILDAGSAVGGRKKHMRTLVVKDTGNHPDIEEGKKPDLTFYANTPEASKAYELNKDELKDAKVTPEERREYLGRAAWPHACMFVEFKAADNKNPFEKRKDEYMPRGTDDARKARGQMYQYATAIMNAQPRTHVFFISI
ncbi:uncharacterized protein LAESUDRAFT_760982 [Laetiporus sulphureus 93-53]|uniref:Fungal-type protein kinase domain-containing protein n=1 Tax=Laetiporus sulphureus 93-53 TaxID=1314785 RepID=A0A165DEC2_9APHY|nr:uncharacterized protein LAESUDRAFT_760982 [Laetiporus sulphureus 93-53]KZT04695.1 hypothetical protein LAESUDRAFT_760982 [Laetiporus sulphureus 93-53]